MLELYKHLRGDGATFHADARRDDHCSLLASEWFTLKCFVGDGVVWDENMIAISASSACTVEKSVHFIKETFHFFCNCQGGRGVLTSDPCKRHWGPSLSAWVTQKRRSSGELLATLCRFDHPGNRTPDLPQR